MANWATTSYRIEGSKEELTRLFGVINDFMTGQRKPSKDSSHDWEGNIVKVLGATEEQVKQNYLRGFIQSYDMEDGFLSIEAEEAWGATDFRKVLVQLMPELTIYFVVEEPGMEVYATNDSEGKYFADRFFVDTCVDDNYRNEYFKHLEDAMAFVAQLLGKNNITAEELETWNEEHEDGDNFAYVHEFEVVDV